LEINESIPKTDIILEHKHGGRKVVTTERATEVRQKATKTGILGSSQRKKGSREKGSRRRGKLKIKGQA